MILTLRSVIIKYILLVGLFSSVTGIQKSVAQATFSVICPDKEIGKNDFLRIEFKVENAEYIETIIPPNFKGFTIVSGPNQQRGMTSINGKTETYVSIGFTLQPSGPGSYKIGSATAKADGKEFTTKPITIKVSKEANIVSGKNPNNSSPFPNLGFDFAPPRPTNRFDDYILKPGENPEEKVKKNLFLKLDVNKTSCYVGEPLTAAFKLYSRLRSETQITDAPSFNGFSVSELDFDSNVRIEEIDGRKYNTYTLRKVQLYPMQEGEILLSPLVANNRVTFFKPEHAERKRQDLFFDLLENMSDRNSSQSSVVQKDIELKSEPRTIHVKPLPDKDVPANFKGAVGTFSIRAEVDKDQLSTDDAGNLHIIISGSGNIQLINAPSVSWPAGIEGFDARMKEELERSSVPIRGRKTFTYPFTLSKAGEYILPPVSFSYFDPETSTYKTIETNSINLHITQGHKKVPHQIAKSQNNYNAGFMQANSSEIIYGTAGSILVLLLILMVRNNLKKKRETSRKEIIIDDIKNASKDAPSMSIPENPLLEAHEKLIEGNANEFFVVLNSSMKKYLSGKFNIPIEEISKKRLHEELDKCNVGVGTAHLLNSLFEEIELNLYSKPQQQHLQNAFEKASEVVALLDKQC
ncbi:MAG: BatD family protein [Ginsengibacter sp.]